MTKRKKTKPSLPKRCYERTCMCSGGQHVQCLDARERNEANREALLALGGLGGAKERRKGQ